MGSFEGCIVQAYWYEDSGQWYLDRRVMTVDTVIDPDTETQRGMWHTVKEKSIAVNSADQYIPCDFEKLHYHPYGRFFFYYRDNKDIIALDRGFTTETGDACTVSEDPTTVNIQVITVNSNSQYISPPAFYGEYTYIAYQHSDGHSYILR